MKNINVFFLIFSSSSAKSLLEKINTPYGMITGGVGLILTFLAFLPLLNGWLKTSSENSYLGIWHTDYTDVYSNDLYCNQKGTTRLYGDNKYAYIGLISCRSDSDVVKLKTVHQFRAGGIWNIEDGHLVFEIRDSNSYPIKTDVNDTPTPFLFSQNVSDVVTKYRPFAFKILEKQDDYFRTKKDALDGSDIIVEFYKKDKEFTVPIAYP